MLSDTIEDRILYRLYERIGIFEETIGEIEPILGKQIGKLAIRALRNDLTPEEQERQADTAADAFLREQHEGNTLQQQADQLIAGDQAFLDEIQSLIGERKVPTPRELYRFLGEFIAQRYPGSSLPSDALKAVTDASLDARFATDLLRELGNTPDLRRIASRIQQGVFPATFDSDAHLRRPHSELISIHHPFVRLACAFLKREAERLHRTFHLRLPADGNKTEGDYLLVVLEFTISGNRARTEIVPIFWDLQGSRAIESDISRHMFIRLLDAAESVEGIPSVSYELIEKGMGSLKKHLDRVRAEMKSQETTLQAARATRRRATQQATLDAKVRAAKLRLEGLESRRAAEFAVRMAKAKLHKEQHRLEAFLRQIGEEATVSIEERELAVALVSIAGRGLETGSDNVSLADWLRTGFKKLRAGGPVREAAAPVVVQPSAPQTPSDSLPPRHVHLGVDFGTCWSKLVLRDYQAPTDRCFVVRPGDPFDAGENYRIPSGVTVEGDRLYFGWAGEHRALQAEAHVISSPKMHAAFPSSAEDPDRSVGLSAVDISILVVTYLLQVGFGVCPSLLCHAIPASDAAYVDVDGGAHEHARPESASGTVPHYCTRCVRHLEGRKRGTIIRRRHRDRPCAGVDHFSANTSHRPARNFDSGMDPV